MKKLTALILFTIVIIGSTCAKVRYQKVTIITDSNNEIYIDNEKSIPEKGKYLLPKDQKTHSITAKRKGYKDATICAVPYLSNGYTYASSFTVGMDMVKLPAKLTDAKNLRVNNVAINIKNKDNKIRIFTDYNKYLRKSDKQEASESSIDKDIEYDNTIFSDKLNDFLKSVGFIDTSDNVLKNGYQGNLITDINVTNYTYHRAPAHQYFDYGGMLYVEMTATYKLMDIYDQEIYSLKTDVKSGYFSYKERSEIQKRSQSAITDALTFGLIDFMNTNEVKKALLDKSEESAENNLSPIKLKTSSGFVSSLSDAVKSSVTVKTKDGHGSGFFVSEDGYIITNFHVIVAAEDLKVIMNDKTEYDVKVVRSSKVHDLALLKIEISGIKGFKISPSKEIEIAADIFAVGTPTASDLSQTVTKGIISGLRKVDENSQLIQIDASINSGNSGGVISNSEGIAVGVVSSKLFGFGVEGVAFGIPAYQIIEKLKLNQ